MLQCLAHSLVWLLGADPSIAYQRYLNITSKVLRVPVPPSTSHFSFQYPRDSRGLSHFSLQYPRVSRGLSAFSTLGTREDSVISAFSTLGTREDSVISASGTLGTRKDSVISISGTVGTREDSSPFRFWYRRDSRGLNHFSFQYPRDS